MSEENGIGEEERLDAIRWADELEIGTAQSNERLRKRLDEHVYSQPNTSRPESPAKLLRHYLAGKWQFHYELPAQIFKRETGKVLPLSRLDALLQSKPSIWPLYLMAYAFAIYYGAFWTKSAGPRNRAGIIDLLYAVYLPTCDVFVTHDTRHGGQYDALRVLNVFNARTPRTHVLNWSQFRAGLIAGG